MLSNGCFHSTFRREDEWDFEELAVATTTDRLDHMVSSILFLENLIKDLFRSVIENIPNQRLKDLINVSLDCLIPLMNTFFFIADVSTKLDIKCDVRG